jgi:hypothetical protein
VLREALEWGFVHALLADDGPEPAPVYQLRHRVTIHVGRTAVKTVRVHGATSWATPGPVKSSTMRTRDADSRSI